MEAMFSSNVYNGFAGVDEGISGFDRAKRSRRDFILSSKYRIEYRFVQAEVK